MPHYTYRGLSIHGEILRGYLSGSSPDDVRSMLHQRQIEPISLRRLWWPRQQPKELTLFFLHLSYALQAGHPLSQSLAMVQSSFRGSFALLVQTLKDSLGQGKMLSDACRLYPWAFSGPLVALLHVGEQSGQFSNACQHAYDYLSKIKNNQKNWRKALASPILNLSFFVFALISFSQNLVPALVSAELENYDHLPWATRLLLAITHWESFYLVYVLVSALGLIWLCLNPLKIPLIGSWIARKHYWSVFSGLVLLIKVNVPLLKALTIIEQSLDSARALKDPIRKMLRDIQEGQTLAQAGEKLPYFPKMYAQFLKAGEGTGQLVQSLELLVSFIQDDISRTLDRWLFWMNPISLALIGLCFWVLIEATICPLYSEIEGNMIGGWL